MSEKSYKDVQNELCRLAKKVHRPTIISGVAHFSDGKRYSVRRDGWRRLYDKKETSNEKA